jgi:RNA polymerase sigma factor (sigma-70 family)
MGAEGLDRALTDEERATTANHMGLVRMHLRQRVRGLHRNLSGREWDDLFQEGCVGLLRAVRSYRPDCGMAFSTYAMPRIKAAIHNALTEQGSLVRQPRAVMRQSAKARARGEGSKSKKPMGRSEKGPADSVIEGLARGFPSGAGDSEERLNFVGLSPAIPDKSCSNSGGLDGRGIAYETLGERMHGRICRAIRFAGAEAAKSSGGRDDRSLMIRRLIQERLLVAEESHQISMRELARQTKSSYARIAHCAKMILEKAAEILDRDSEARSLSAAAGRHERGWRTYVTESLNRELEGDRSRRFRLLLMRSGAEVRALLLWRLLAKHNRQNEHLLGALFDRLKSEEKSRVVEQLEDSAGGSFQSRLDPAA